MDREHRNEAGSFWRRLPGSALLILFDSIPGYDIFGPVPEPTPAVIQNAQNAHVEDAAAPGGGDPNASRLFMSTQEARGEGVVLASVAAQVSVNVDNDELEDYGDSCDEEDEDDEDEDEVDTHPQEAPNSGIVPPPVRAQALASVDNEEEDHDYSSDEEDEDEVDTDPQNVEPVQEVTPNYDAAVDVPAAQHEAAVVYRRPEEQEDQSDMSNTVVQHKDVDPAQEGHASNTTGMSLATFKSITSPGQDQDGAVDLEITPTEIQLGVDPTEAGAVLDHNPLSCTTTLHQDQVARGAVLVMRYPATSNTIAAPTEALESPGPESIEEEQDAVCLALRAVVARPPGTGSAHSPNPTLEIQVTFSVKPVNADAAAATNHDVEVKTRVESSLDCHEEGRMASTALHKELEHDTPFHESSNSSTASSSS